MKQTIITSSSDKKLELAKKLGATSMEMFERIKEK